MAHSDAVQQSALHDWEHFPDMTAKEIGRKYGVSASTVVLWAQKAKLKSRTRGRRALLQPNARQRKVLQLYEVMTLEQVAQKMGMHKQSVHRIVKRWRKWQPTRHAPFAPGDIVEWNGQRYIVVLADKNSGTVLDEQGRTNHRFGWNMGGKRPVKVGVNRKYAATVAH